MSELRKRSKVEKKRKSDANNSSVNAPYALLEQPMLMQYGIALALTIIAYIGFRITYAPIVLPGESSIYLPVASEVIPRFTYKNHIWQSFLNILFDIGGSAAFINNVCSIISALAIGMLYLVVSSLMGLYLNGNALGGILKADNPNGEINVEKTTSRLQYYASILSGVTAALILAFCPPYWMSSTLSYYHSFYLLWLLISAYLLLRFAMSTKLPYLYAFCFIHSLGFTQSSVFVAFAPVFYIYAAYVLLASEKLNIKSAIISTLLTILGFCFIFYVVSAYCSSEVAEITNKTDYFAILKEVLGSLVRGVYADLHKVGWMVILGTTIAPFVASIISGRRSLSGEGDWGFYALNIAIFVTTLIVVFDTRLSLWNMFGYGSPFIIPYTLVAMTFGYSIAYIYLLSVYLFKYIPTYLNFGAFVRYFAIALSAVVCIYTTIVNYPKADNSRLVFMNTYVDALIDGMGERKWLVTEGFLDDAIKVRSKEKNKEIYLIDWGYSYNTITRSFLKKNIRKEFPNNIRLINKAEIGIMPLLQEWLQNIDNADENIALMLFPDLWSYGEYDSYPSGLAFCGMDPQELMDYNLDESVKIYKGNLEKIGEQLPEFKVITPNEMTRVDHMSYFVRRNVSFIGNNLAYVLEQQGKIDEAFDLYYQVHKFDPNNISALLNFSALVRKYEKFSSYTDESKAALDDFIKRDSSTKAIWSISRVYGYVSNPKVFTQLGWTWALSGQNNMALKSLARVLDHADVENTNLLRNMMARIHANQNNIEESEEIYLQNYRDDPADTVALQGLIYLYMKNGDFEKAKKWLGPAEKAGVPRSDILYCTATMLVFSNELDAARAVVKELLDISPDNTQAILLQIQIYQAIYQSAENDTTTRNEIIKNIGEEIDKLKNKEGPDSLITSMTEGSFKELKGDYQGARASFMIALKQTRSKDNVHKNINPIPIYEEILKMDINLNDKDDARAHARQILHIDANNWLANYALGSLSLNVGDFIEAEDYLKQSYESNDKSLMVINDLAYAKYMLGKMKEATILIEKGIELDRELYILWDTYGCIMLKQNKLSEAQAYFEEAIKLFDGDLRPHLHLAQTYFYMKNYDKCHDIMRRLSSSADTFVGHDREEYDALAQALIGLK